MQLINVHYFNDGADFCIYSYIIESEGVCVTCDICIAVQIFAWSQRSRRAFSFCTCSWLSGKAGFYCLAQQTASGLKKWPLSSCVWLHTKYLPPALRIADVVTVNRASQPGAMGKSSSKQKKQLGDERRCSEGKLWL